MDSLVSLLPRSLQQSSLFFVALIVLFIELLTRLRRRNRTPAPAPSPAPSPAPGPAPVCFPRAPQPPTMPTGPSATVTIPSGSITTFSAALAALGVTGGTIFVDGSVHDVNNPLDTQMPQSPNPAIEQTFLRITSLNPAQKAVLANDQDDNANDTLRFTNATTSQTSQTVVIDNIELWSRRASSSSFMQNKAAVNFDSVFSFTLYMSNTIVRTQRFGVLQNNGTLNMYIDSCTFESFYSTIGEGFSNYIQSVRTTGNNFVTNCDFRGVIQNESAVASAIQLLFTNFQTDTNFVISNNRTIGEAPISTFLQTSLDTSATPEYVANLYMYDNVVDSYSFVSMNNPIPQLDTFALYKNTWTFSFGEEFPQYSFIDIYSNFGVMPVSYNTKYYGLDNTFPTTATNFPNYVAATTNNDPFFAGFDRDFFIQPDLLEQYPFFTELSCSDPNAVPISQITTRSSSLVPRTAPCKYKPISLRQRTKLSQ